MFEIKYSNTFVKTLLKYDSKVIERVRFAISKLPNGDIKKLHSNSNFNFYRLRVGKFRIIIRMENNIFYIDKIDTRGDIYK